jgi:hypothetical protein
MPDKPVQDTLLYVAIAAALLVGAWFFIGGTSSPGIVGPVAVSPPIPVPAVVEPREKAPVQLPPESSPAETKTAITIARPEPSADSISVITKRAATDPAAALATALRETDPELRQLLVNAVLKIWASTEPDAAARAALTWPGSDRVGPIVAVLEGVATRPGDALRLGIFFCREDPAWAPEHGRALIKALSDAGQHSAAVSFALVGGAEVEGEDRNKLLTAAFAGWAQREPQLAAIAATSDLPEEGMRQEALIAVLKHWRQLNPGAPEKFLEQLPPGPERTALVAALAATSGP